VISLGSNQLILSEKGSRSTNKIRILIVILLSSFNLIAVHKMPKIGQRIREHSNLGGLTKVARSESPDLI
jgi:hypothetical protein